MITHSQEDLVLKTFNGTVQGVVTALPIIILNKKQKTATRHFLVELVDITNLYFTT